MRRKMLQHALLPAIVLGLAACANPAEDKPAAVVNAPGASTPADGEAAEGTTFVMGEESAIEFTGSKVTGSHEGGFEEFDGSITVVDGDATRSRVDVTIDTTSLWSDNDDLTGHLKSPDFFDVATYPTAEFHSSSIELTPTGYDVTGELTLHGVTKTITFPASILLADDEVSANAEFVIKRFDFGIEYAGPADNLIRDDVVIRLHLVAHPDEGSHAS